MIFKTLKDLAGHFGTVESMLSIQPNGDVIAPDVDGDGISYNIIAEVAPGGFKSLVNPSDVVIPKEGKTYSSE